MENKYICYFLQRIVALILAALLLVTGQGSFSLHVYGQALGSGRDRTGQIELKSLKISLNNEAVYDSDQLLPTAGIRLTPNSTMSFSLHWDVVGAGDDFREGDYFSIPVVYVDNLQLTEPFTQQLKLDAGGGRKVAVAEGKFTYEGGLLAFQVVFNEDAANYRIRGGPAGGYAELRLSSGQTQLPLVFDDESTVTIDIETGPGEILPGVPTFPTELATMSKSMFSPDVDGGVVNLLTRYPTMQPGDETKFGLDWRMTFFDLVSHFQRGGVKSENVIIEDTVGKGQEFANFANFAPGDLDKGFNTFNDEEQDAPFFIELPIVAVGSNRIYNLYGGDTLTSGSGNHYVGTLIRANQLEELQGGSVADSVRQKPLSWGIEQLDDGREKLIINLGRLGPDVAAGEGLRADMVKERDYPYAVLDDVIVKELLDAQRMIEVQDADVEQWKRVRRESLATILHYWPGYRNKLCDIAGIPPGSSDSELETALFAMSYSQLSQSKITTLGYDERHSGGIAGTMQIDSFVLRYRTVLPSVTDVEISNTVKVATGIVNKEDTTSYNHQFYADIFGTVNVGEVVFVKSDATDGYTSGETTEEAIRNIRGLAGAEFEVYEVEGGAPLRFTRSGNVYALNADGNVTLLLTDDTGAFKITGLSPNKRYALYEKKAPSGYELPAQRHTEFMVSNSVSKYYIVINEGTPTEPPTTTPPDTPDTPDTPNTPGIPDIPDTPTTPPTITIPPSDVPLLGYTRNTGLAKLLMLISALVMAVQSILAYRARRVK